MSFPAGEEGAGAGPDPVAAAPAGRGQRRVATGVVLLAWLVLVFPAFTGKARFPVDFAGTAPGKVSAPLRNAELGDAFYAFHPWRSYLGARLAAGDAPLWDPYRFAGTPFAADITIGTWYPPNWLYASGSVVATFTAIAVASILAALLLAYWFFLVVELHPYAAALGAITFVCSAFMMKWSTNEAVFASAMWLPLALGGLEVARRGRVGRGVLLAASGLALSVLGGHAQVALLVWSAAGIWFASGVVVSLRAGAPGGGGERWPRRLGRLAWPGALAVALGGGLAAVQILPTAAFARDIVRQETPFARARATALPASHVPTLLVPEYHGSPVDGNYEGRGPNFTETAAYSGLLVFPLAALALLRRPERLAVFFGVLVLVAALAVFGSPLYRAVLALPGFSRTLFTTRFILLLNFGLAGLAAVGLHRLVEGGARRAMPVVLGSAGALVAAVLALVLTRVGTEVAGEYVARQGLRAVAVTLLGTLVLALVVRSPSRAAPAALAVVAVAFLDLWMFGSRLNAFHTARPVHARSPGIEFLAARPGPRPRFVNVGDWMVPPNGELQHRLYGISGYDPFVPRRIVELVSVAEDQRASARINYLGPFTPGAVAAPVFDLLGVSTVVAPPHQALPGRLLYDGEFKAYDRPSAFPAAWITSCWEVRPEAEVLPRLAAMTGPELAGTAVVTDEGAAHRLPPPGGGERPCGSAGRAGIERYAAERVVMAATAETAGILVLSDAWFDGWRAEVDGRPAPVLRVDHALRGVALPPGRHTVELVYRPASQAAGSAVTLATVGGVLVAVALRARRRRRHGGDGRPSPPVPATGPPPAG